jgi:hypothetical protein
MSEIISTSLSREQEKAIPMMEDEIRELLTGDLKETALELVAYLNVNHLTPLQWFGPHYWRIPYETNYLCSILMDKDRWRVFFFSGDYSGAFTEGFIQVVQASVMPCISCTGDNCPKGRNMTVFGKAFSNTCFQFPVQFVNPNGRTIEYIKELLEYWKEVAPRSESWHAH